MSTRHYPAVMERKFQEDLKRHLAEQPAQTLAQIVEHLELIACERRAVGDVRASEWQNVADWVRSAQGAASQLRGQAHDLAHWKEGIPKC